ncbi:MAG: hypothetical protein ABI681_09335 [Gemmatimonadales bacterium]
MRLSHLAASAAILAALGCKEAAAPGALPTFHLTAAVTESNDCTVNVMDKTYASKGQIRGDVPIKFIGTVAEKSYHGFGCWVATNGGDGDLIVLFSGNNLGKPLDVGTYALVHDVLDDTPRMFASISFRPSELGGDKLRSIENGTGSVVVDSIASGARRITVNADVVRWGAVF